MSSVVPSLPSNVFSSSSCLYNSTYTYKIRSNNRCGRIFEARGKTYLVRKILTIAELLVMNEAKLVGTKPGATQFTRVLGAISAAKAYTSYLHNYQISKTRTIAVHMVFKREIGRQVQTLVSPRSAVLVTPYIAIEAGGL